MGYRSTPAQLQPRATWSAPCKYHHSTIKSTAGSTYCGTPAKTAPADLPTGRQFNTAVSFLEQRFLMEIIEANPFPDGKSRRLKPLPLRIVFGAEFPILVGMM